ncbi:MAG: integral rane sensor signal transduction histidine kinase, partial [Thermoleophilia bacterium]|nr:integral rane sensor signal transduction histidine kinase [Thermoleophilia bacterium]
MRIAAAFTIAMIAVLAIIGAYVYNATSRALDRAMTDALETRLADSRAVAANTADGDAVESLDFGDREDTFVQIVDLDGAVISDHGDDNLEHGLPRRFIRQATTKPRAARLQVEHGEPPVRLLFTRTQLADGTPVVVVAGASLAARRDTLESLGGILLAGGLIGAVCAAFVGYVAVAMSLRPVERMRRQASTITPTHTQRRLEVPNSDDELSRLAVTLNEMLARLDEGLQRERQLTADASHELRTPLALLKTEIEVALAASQTTEGSVANHVDYLRTTLQSSEVEVDRLIQLAESLLLLAQSDQDTLPVVRRAVDLRTLFDDLAARYARRAEREGRSISFDAPDAWIDVDPIRTAQALGNLIDNAFRHGTGAVTVHATLHSPELELVLEVRDEGPGIPASLADHAFDRFTREEASRTSHGAGLGLSIVRAIAQAHGGTARVAQRDDVGSIELHIP